MLRRLLDEASRQPQPPTDRRTTQPPCSLAEFVRRGWHVVEPTRELVWNWHIEAVCQHLEAVSRRDIRKLIINIPPGHAKSRLVSVYWPAWEWLWLPSERSIFGTYAMDLTLRDSLYCKDLIESEWYLAEFEPAWALSPGLARQDWYRNTRGGERLAVSVGSRGTGFRGDKVVGDDLLSVEEAYSEAARQRAVRWWTKTMSTRVNDPREGAFVLIQQRLHEVDPAGHCIAEGGWELLKLQTEFEPRRRVATAIGWSDPRTEEGELLFPQMYDREVIAEFKRTLGSDFFAQHQQEPSPAAGEVFQRHWWRHWVPLGLSLPPIEVRLSDGSSATCVQASLPTRFDRLVLSADCTFKGSEGADFVALGVWGQFGPDVYLLDYVLARLSFTATLDAIRGLRTAWPQIGAVLIEDAANGPAVIDTLSREVPGLLAASPDGGKLARAHATTGYVRAGNVYLPHPLHRPDIERGLDQLGKFPRGANDDFVDQLTQALLYLFVRSGSTGRAVMTFKPSTPGSPWG